MRLLLSKPKYVIAAGVMTFALAILASGWASTYQRLQDQLEVNRMQREANRREGNINLVSLNGALAAWRFQQAEAGRYESEWLDTEKKLRRARGYIGNLRSELKQCNATNSMITDDGWTGSAYIRPGGNE